MTSLLVLWWGGGCSRCLGGFLWKEMVRFATSTRLWTEAREESTRLLTMYGDSFVRILLARII